MYTYYINQLISSVLVMLVLKRLGVKLHYDLAIFPRLYMIFKALNPCLKYPRAIIRQIKLEQERAS
jgi:hypothetical protein